MNANRIVKMLIGLLIGRAASHGLRTMSRRQDKTGPDADQQARANETGQRMKQTTRLTRKIGKF